MTTAEYGVLAAVAVQALTGFRWLVGLEARIGAHEKGCDERMKRLDERHSAILDALHEIKARL